MCIVNSLVYPCDYHRVHLCIQISDYIYNNGDRYNFLTIITMVSTFAFKSMILYITMATCLIIIHSHVYHHGVNFCIQINDSVYNNGYLYNYLAFTYLSSWCQPLY